MWSAFLLLLLCRLTYTGDNTTAEKYKPTSRTFEAWMSSMDRVEVENISTTTQHPSVTFSLSAGAPVYLRLGNHTIDSTKSFKVPQSENAALKEVSTLPTATSLATSTFAPHVVVPPKHTYFDHHRRYGPNFEYSDGNVTKVMVQLGEDANLNCRITLLQDKTVSWVRRRAREGVPELLTVGAVTYSADPRLDLSTRYPGNWRLVIRSARAEDEGVYECQISTHPPRAINTLLTVTTPAVWVVDELGEPLLEKYYEAESTLSLMCRARHLESPVQLVWLHEGKVLNDDTSRGGISVKTEQVSGGADSQLLVSRLGHGDAGNYTCAVRGRPIQRHTVAVHVLNESLAELHAGAACEHACGCVRVPVYVCVALTLAAADCTAPAPLSRAVAGVLFLLPTVLHALTHAISNADKYTLTSLIS